MKKILFAWLSQIPYASAFAHNVLMGVATFFLAAIAHYLALPPSNAITIFPPTGLLLIFLLVKGLRILPGFFIGMVAFEIWLSGLYSHPPSILLMMAFGTATFISLQGILGQLLILKTNTYPSVLSNEKQILIFLGVGGPLACLISPSLSLLLLWQLDIVPTHVLGTAWIRWWIGDSLGVIVMTPILISFLMDSQEGWKGRSIRVVLPMLFGVAVVAASFVWVNDSERGRLQSAFREQTDTAYENLARQLQIYEMALTSMERFVALHPHIEREDFRSYVEEILKKNKGIQALEWVPKIEATDRTKWEDKASQDAPIPFRILERDRWGRFIPAPTRTTYFPVLFVEPYLENARIMGINLMGDPVRAQTLMRAQDEGSVVASPGLKLIQAGDQQAGIISALAVYEGHDRPTVIAQRQKRLKGFVLSVYQVPKFVEESIPNALKTQFFRLTISDIDNQQAHVLYRNHAQVLSKSLPGLTRTEYMFIGGRQWQFVFEPTATFLGTHSDWQAWAVFTTGLLVLGALGVFLLSITGRAYEIDCLIDQRTAELQGIFENTVEGLLILNHSGFIDSINPAAQTLFGGSTEAFIGQPIQLWLPNFPPLTHLENGSRIELQTVQQADQPGIPLAVGVGVLTLSDHIPLFIVTLHDLREQRRNERMKDEFISSVSHELRTPLTSIQGSLSLMRGGMLGLMPAPAVQLLEIAHRNGERLLNLINDILDLSKLELGELTIHLEKKSVISLLEQAIELNAGYAEKLSVTLQFIPPETSGHLWIEVDAHRFQQVLSNLISNACKFSNEGDTVSLEIEEHNNALSIRVIDQGAGIPEAFHGRIFGKFAQADSSDTRRHGGTGLGLNITKKLVEGMNGTIGFISPYAEGKGTCFYITFPCKFNLLE